MAMRDVLPDKVPDSPSDLDTMVQIQTSTQTRTQTKVVSSHESVSFPFPIASSRFHQFIYCGKFDDYNKGLKGDEELYRTFISVNDDPYAVMEVIRGDAGRAIDKFASGIFRLREIFKLHDEETDVSDVIPDDVGTTLNVHPILHKGFTPLTINSKPIELALYVRDERGGQFMVAIDQHEASLFRIVPGEPTDESEKKVDKSLALVNVHSGVVYPISGEFNVFYRKWEESDLQSLDNNVSFLVDRVCLKIFSGDLNLSWREQLALFARCSQLGVEHGFKKMSRYIQEYVCVVCPQAQLTKEGVLRMLEDEGKSLIRNTILQFTDRSKGSPDLHRKVETLTKEVDRDMSIIYSAEFVQKLLTLDTELQQQPIE